MGPLRSGPISWLTPHRRVWMQNEPMEQCQFSNLHVLLDDIFAVTLFFLCVPLYCPFLSSSFSFTSFCSSFYNLPIETTMVLFHDQFRDQEIILLTT